MEACNVRGSFKAYSFQCRKRKELLASCMLMLMMMCKSCKMFKNVAAVGTAGVSTSRTKPCCLRLAAISLHTSET